MAVRPESCGASSFLRADDGGGDNRHVNTYYRVHEILTGLTPENVPEVVTQMEAVAITELPVLAHVITMVYDKACTGPAAAKACAALSRLMRMSMQVTVDGQLYFFRKVLLMKCEWGFSPNWLNQQGRAEREEAIKMAELTDEMRAQLLAELDEYEAEMKTNYRAFFALMRFMGEIFLECLITVRIAHQCIDRLFTYYERCKDDEWLECICDLLTAIGAEMDLRSILSITPRTGPPPMTAAEHQEKMKVYLDKMHTYAYNQIMSNRIRYKLLDVVKLGRRGWKPERRQ